MGNFWIQLGSIMMVMAVLYKGVEGTDCYCEHPGDMGSGKNGITCTNGDRRYCASYQVCYSGGSFQWGNWPCAVYCQCDNPGSYEQNGFRCSDGMRRSCASSEYCYNNNSWPQGQWSQGCKRKTDFNRQDLVIRKKKERNRRLVEIVMYLLGFTI